MKIIITGITGMVGEGVLLECLEHPMVNEVLSVSRRPAGFSHSKLKEYIVPAFRCAVQVNGIPAVPDKIHWDTIGRYVSVSY